MVGLPKSSSWGRSWEHSRGRHLSLPTLSALPRNLPISKAATITPQTDKVNAFLRTPLSDPAREQELGHNKSLISPVPPTTEFDVKELSTKEEVIKAARSVSAEHCTVCMNTVRNFLINCGISWELSGRPKESPHQPAEVCQVCLDTQTGESQKHRAVSNYLPTQHRHFSASSPDGQKKVTKFLLKNNDIDASIQKGGISGTPGCLEHTALVTH